MFESLVANFRLTIASAEFQYTSLIFALFVLPKFLVRLGIPFALSAFAMGVGASLFGFELSHNDVVKVLSSLGIVALFLFAGLEVEISELRRNRSVLWQHVAMSLAILILASVVVSHWLHLDTRSSILVGLAIITPSTGFILDTLEAVNVPEASKFWIRSKAIAAEIVALFIMFVLVRSMSFSEFLIASIGMALLILALPLAFRFFARAVEPVAPRSEFGFLLMIALLSGMITKKLGAYYLIGAFVVGIVARRFERSMPKMSSVSMLKSLTVFTNFFIPFYFFHAGAGVMAEELSLRSLLIGGALLLVFLPIRIFTVVWQRRYSLGEPSAESFPIATSLLPNLVFGLVIAELMKSQFQVPTPIIGAVIVYTVGSTLAPPILLRYFWKSTNLTYLTETESDFAGFTRYQSNRPSDEPKKP